MSNSETGLPFDDIKNLVSSLSEYNVEMAHHTASQLEEMGYANSDKIFQINTWLSASTVPVSIVNCPALIRGM